MKTSQLEQWLETDQEFDETLIKENGCPERCTMIIANMDEKGITRAELIKRLKLDRNYEYQLLNGTRSNVVHRFKNLCIAVSFKDKP